jgi:hypothetical protein
MKILGVLSMIGGTTLFFVSLNPHHPEAVVCQLAGLGTAFLLFGIHLALAGVCRKIRENKQMIEEAKRWRANAVYPED